jgi:L-lactate dehydrogenase complex protein LldG
MSSREEILGRLRRQGTEDGLGVNLSSEISIPAFDINYIGDPIAKFKEVLDILHTEVVEVKNLEEIAAFVLNKYTGKRIISTIAIDGLGDSENWKTLDPHDLQDVEFALFESTLGVAENGAIWLSEAQMGQRVAPFICQRMGLIVKKDKVVPLMHQAYELLEISELGFGTFISGPSKTADIEQSLVIGAHGSRELFVFLM